MLEAQGYTETKGGNRSHRPHQCIWKHVEATAMKAVGEQSHGDSRQHSGPRFLLKRQSEDFEHQMETQEMHTIDPVKSEWVGVRRGGLGNPVDGNDHDGDDFEAPCSSLDHESDNLAL